jgi:hypothetical protein
VLCIVSLFENIISVIVLGVAVREAIQRMFDLIFVVTYLCYSVNTINIIDPVFIPISLGLIMVQRHEEFKE